MNGFGFKVASALDGRLRIERDPEAPAPVGPVPARIRRRMLTDATATAVTGAATIAAGLDLAGSWLPWRRSKGRAMIAQGMRDLTEAGVSLYAWAQADRTAFAAPAEVISFDFTASPDQAQAVARRRFRDEVYGGVYGRHGGRPFTTAFPDGEPTFTRDEVEAGHGFGGDGDFPSAGHEVDEGVVQPVFGSPSPVTDQLRIVDAGGAILAGVMADGTAFGIDGLAEALSGTRTFATGGVVRNGPYLVGDRCPEVIGSDFAVARAGGPDEQV